MLLTIIWLPRPENPLKAELVVYAAPLRTKTARLDHGGHQFSSATLHAENDASAIARARQIYRSGTGSGYRILRNGIEVHVEEFSPRAVSTTDRVDDQIKTDKFGNGSTQTKGIDDAR